MIIPSFLTIIEKEIMSGKVDIHIEWIKENAAGEVCAECHEPIFGLVHRMYTDVMSEKWIKSNIVLCDPCYEKLGNESKPEPGTP